VHHASGYEPFKYGDNFTASITFLLEQARKAGVYHASVTQPVTLVVKELARELSGDNWANWMPLVKHFVVIMRDPHVQLWSQMRRFANDIFYNQRGADGLNETQVRAMADQVGTLLERGGTIGKLRFPGDFNRTAWKDLKRHSRALDSHLKDHPHKQLLVIDGFLLRADPESMMAEVLTRLHIPFDATTLARVVSQWLPETARHLKEGTTEPDSAYRTRSVQATGYEPPLEDTPPLHTFPVSLQRHLVETAMPVYLELLQRPERLGPRTPQALIQVIRKEVNGVAFIDRNPVSAYALLSSVGKNGRKTGEGRGRAVTLSALRQQFPEHGAIFNLIDQHGRSTLRSTVVVAPAAISLDAPGGAGVPHEYGNA
jgi:hypothetical protein